MWLHSLSCIVPGLETSFRLVLSCLCACLKEALIPVARRRLKGTSAPVLAHYILGLKQGSAGLSVLETGGWGCQQVPPPLSSFYSSSSSFWPSGQPWASSPDHTCPLLCTAAALPPGLGSPRLLQVVQEHELSTFLLHLLCRVVRVKTTSHLNYSSSQSLKFQGIFPSSIS